MNDLKLALRQVWYVNLAFIRNPASAFFTLVFPLMFLVIFTVIFGGGTVPIAPGKNVAVSTFYIPAISTFSIVTACYTNIAVSLSFSRDAGTLKRMRGSPLPAWSYITARIIHAVLVAILLVVLCSAFGAIFYQATLPTTTLPAFALTVVVGAASFCALGIAVTSFIPNADAAPAVVNASILPLLFISNVFVPLTDPPAWLNTVSRIFPVRHLADAMIGSFFKLNGNGLHTNDLLVVAAWGAGAILVAVRFFKWEPRT